jgi:hypothetical protein
LKEPTPAGARSDKTFLNMESMISPRRNLPTLNLQICLQPFCAEVQHQRKQLTEVDENTAEAYFSSLRYY